MFCQWRIINEIFDNFVELKNTPDEIEKLFCSEAGKAFITDVYESFEFEKFEIIVRTICRNEITRRLIDFTSQSIETHLSGEENSLDPGQYGVQANSQDQQCELNIRRTTRQRIYGVPGSAEGPIPGLERFPNQRRMDEDFRGDAISGQERYVSKSLGSLHSAENQPILWESVFTRPLFISFVFPFVPLVWRST